MAREQVALTRDNWQSNVPSTRFEAPVWNADHTFIERYDRTDGFMYRIVIGETPVAAEKYARLVDLPNFITVLKALNWSTWYDPYHGIVNFKPGGRILNGAVVVQKHRARTELRARERALAGFRVTYETLRDVRIQRLDENVLRAMVAQVRAWPEVMEVAFMGTKIKGDNPVYPIESGLLGEILVRFYPVYFSPENGDEGKNVNGLTTPCTFGVDMSGAVRFIEGVHPHVYAEGKVCVGEAEFDRNQMHSLDQLRHWYVGTDGGPANQDWHQSAEQFWTNLNWREGGGAGLWFNARYVQEEPSLYIAAPDDNSAEAEMRELTLNNVHDLMHEAAPRMETVYCTNCDRAYEYEEDDDNPLYQCSNCENDFCARCEGWHGWSMDDAMLLCTSCFNNAEERREDERRAEEEAQEQEDEDDEDEMPQSEFDREQERIAAEPAITVFAYPANEHRFTDVNGLVWAGVAEPERVVCSRCRVNYAIWQTPGVGERCRSTMCLPVGPAGTYAPNWQDTETREPVPEVLYREDYEVAAGPNWRCEYPDYFVFVRGERGNTTGNEACTVQHPGRSAIWRVNAQNMHDRSLEGRHIAGYLCQEHYEALPSRAREEATTAAPDLF